MYVAIYNALTSSASRIVRLPVSSMGPFHVSRMGNLTVDAAGETISFAIPSPFDTKASANYVLPFDTGPLLPVGVTLFRVTQTKDEPDVIVSSLARNSVTQLGSHEADGRRQEEFVVSNEILSVRFSRYVFKTKILRARLLECHETSANSLYLDVWCLIFCSETGEMIQIATNDTALNVSQVWGYYTSFDSRLDTAEGSSAGKVQVCVSLADPACIK